MERRKGLTAALAALALSGCSAVDRIGDWMSSPTVRAVDCAGVPHDVVMALIQASPLLVDPAAPVSAGDAALESALRWNGVRIGRPGAGLPVELRCRTLGEGEDGVSVALMAPGQWEVTAAVYENGVHGAISTIGFDGEVPPAAPEWARVAAVGNNATFPVEEDAAVEPESSDLIMMTPTVTEGIASDEGDGESPISAPDPADAEDGLADVPAVPIVAEPIDPVPAAPPLAAPPPTRPPVHPVCAVLRPPSLRNAVEAALICAGSYWRLVPPTAMEPRDYALPLPVDLPGQPENWIRLLSDQYGLRFEWLPPLDGEVLE